MSERNILTVMQELLDRCEQGPVRDQQQGRLDRFTERLAALPKKVADQAPFATKEEAEAVLRKEYGYVVAAIDGTN